MRAVQRRQMQFGQVAIGDIWLDPKSRDDIPAVLKGLQYLYTERRDELFGLLDSLIRPGTDRTVGRPGMNLWRILVLGVLKQGLGCDFDRLHDLANHHRTVLTVFRGREKIGLRGARGQLRYPTSDCYPLEFRKRQSLFFWDKDLSWASIRSGQDGAVGY